MANSHLIYRQILEISFPSKKEAMDGQHELSQLYRREVMPLINEVFDELAPANDHIRIDRLEFDIGQLTAHNLREDLRQGLRTMLEDELHKEIQKAHFHRHRNGDDGKWASNRYRSEERSVYSPDQSDIELFTYFIKTGQLPWWAGKEQVQSLNDLAITLVDNQPKRLLDLLSKGMTSGTYNRRLIHQFPDHILMKFIELKSSGMEVGEQIKHLHEDFYHLHRHKQLVPLNKSNFRLLLWQSAFRFWLFGDDSAALALNIITSDDWNLKPTSDTESRGDKGNMRRSPVVPKNEIQSYLLFLIKVLAEKTGGGAQSEIVQAHQSKEEQLTHLLLQRMVDMGIQDQSLGKMITALVGLSDSNLRKAFSAKYLDQIEKITGDEDEEADRVETSQLLAEDTFEIQNGGLVIIAPFLPRFFDALGLVSENKFITDKAAERAALLLQYIATGETEMPEYELVLNKILCGLSIDEPLPRSLEINHPEREEVDNLLESVIEHWEALKDTSAEGLQQTFLVKDGLLSAEANGWILRVERTAVDVLLDHLPWSISLIKLPWNEDMIHVEW